MTVCLASFFETSCGWEATVLNGMNLSVPNNVDCDRKCLERAWSWEDILKWLNYLVSSSSLPQSQTSVIVIDCLQLHLKFWGFILKQKASSQC